MGYSDATGTKKPLTEEAVRGWNVFNIVKD
jgi:hypothetical protein